MLIALTLCKCVLGYDNLIGWYFYAQSQKPTAVLSNLKDESGLVRLRHGPGSVVNTPHDHRYQYVRFMRPIRWPIYDVGLRHPGPVVDLKRFDVVLVKKFLKEGPDVSIVVGDLSHSSAWRLGGSLK